MVLLPMQSNTLFLQIAYNVKERVLKNNQIIILHYFYSDHLVGKLNLAAQAPKIRFIAKAQFPGSNTVNTGVLLGI